MTNPKIKNIVFDIGNVFVRWDPELVCTLAFGREKASPQFIQSLFEHDIWHKLNRGEMDEQAAKSAYRKAFSLTQSDIDEFFFQVKDTQTLKYDTVDLIDSLARAGYRLFALTDNIREILVYLRSKYDFWKYFEGIVSSADVGVQKPSHRIFDYLLQTYKLKAEETVFLDDLPGNTESAKAMKMSAIQFFDASLAKADLIKLGVRI